MEIVSIFSLILNAGLVVQAVMLILVLMSIYSWTIIASKKKSLMDSSKDIKNFNKKFSLNLNPEKLYQTLSPSSTPMQAIFAAGFEEFTHHTSETQAKKAVNAERAYREMNTEASHQIDTINKELSVLAMIASSSPYIGLFGTVWGIMHSFIGLASVKQATIAIVAPGIAEALIATAFGLFAAIPATIAYNRLTTQVGEISNTYTDFVEKMFVIFQR